MTISFRKVRVLFLLWAVVFVTASQLKKHQDGAVDELEEEVDESTLSLDDSAARNLQFQAHRPLQDFVMAPTPAPTTCQNNHPGFEDPAHVTFENCDAETTKRLKFAVRYMRAAAVTDVFAYCMRRAVFNKQNFPFSSNEKDSASSDYVGSYQRCSLDPSFIQAHSLTTARKVAHDIVMNTVRDRRSQRKINLQCNALASGTAQRYNNIWGYYDNWNTQKTHKIRFHYKISNQYSAHTNGEFINPIFGTPNGGSASPSYPVDELSGIILHHMIGSLGFHSNSDSCGWTTTNYNGYSCDGVSGNSCRFNGLNEIAEQCMSDTVQRSTDNCDPEQCTGSRWELPVLDGQSTCSCESFW